MGRNVGMKRLVWIIKKDDARVSDLHEALL